jgi:hypothetical protein
MDISNLRTTLDPTSLPSAAASTSASGSAPNAAQAAGSTGSASGTSQPSAPPAQAANLTPSALQKAVQKINQQLEQSSGVTLSAGLDTSGAHPGQVLVELSDKSTRQTFFKYYVPATQVVQASQSLGGASGSAGALISAKA